MAAFDKRSIFYKLLQRVRSLLTGLEMDVSNGPPSDRRVWIRYPCEIQGTCGPAHQADAVKIRALVKNISRGGINLQVARSVENGSVLSVALSDQQDDDNVASVLAYVVHAEKLSEKQWSLGCTFAVALEENDLSEFGAMRCLAEPSDHRTWVRFQCSGEARYQIARVSDSPTHIAKVFDISSSGIGLLVRQPLGVGVVLHILASSGSRILATVVRVSKVGDQWAMGCTFIRELENGELENIRSD